MNILQVELFQHHEAIDHAYARCILGETLHTALSEGIHAQTDEECLEIASSIRIVLTELAERISTALKDDAELTDAVSRLLHRHTSERVDSNDTTGTRD